MKTYVENVTICVEVTHTHSDTSIFLHTQRLERKLRRAMGAWMTRVGGCSPPLHILGMGSGLNGAPPQKYSQHHYS